MERRSLVKAFAALPLMPLWFKKYSASSDPPTCVAELKSGNYLMFIDVKSYDWIHLAKLQLPIGVTIQYVPLFLQANQSIGDAVRLYKIEET